MPSEPFMAPRFCRWLTGDFIIYFVNISSPASETRRDELEYFYYNRDEILKRAMELLKLTEHEKELVRTKLLK
ncbi:hypothetical protein CC1G_07265 [Coprinopsis cinerea okayama7|uniref:Uncharacterized protein n=1 Tax=Coprinopsis cinerea (strain Okayama-7 / 130 / ATCC MYA-4618 / FGSC 9003) TaxID=240176 RepID=A8PD53_COPC7|nr:hypothetical protein CC1G_07265 [Coprinopsis cinerea okayama7\|eukprot:XP_001840535.1 hypothetical protein CC1G_07265 [Coprinopsis cinerea okayama7\